MNTTYFTSLGNMSADPPMRESEVDSALASCSDAFPCSIIDRSVMQFTVVSVLESHAAPPLKISFPKAHRNPSNDCDSLIRTWNVFLHSVRIMGAHSDPSGSLT